MKGPMGGQCAQGCKCGMCQGKTCGMGGGCWLGHSCWYRVIRCVLGIAIILIVFGFGVMIGQLRGELAGSGRRMMNSYGGGYGRAYPMMQSGQGGTTAIPSQAAPATPAK